eukprot:g4850.t1
MVLSISNVESITMAHQKNYVENFMNRLKPSTDGAGVLVFSHRKDKTAKSLEKDHPHLEFLLCYDKNVATELGYEFPSILLLRDGEILALPDYIEFGNKEGIDLWLMRKWYSTMTEVSMANQEIIFSPDTGSTTTLIYLDELGTQRKDHLDAFRSVAKMWTTKELRNDLPRAVYASKYRLLEQVKDEKSSGYIAAVNMFWKSFEERFLRLSEDETSKNSIMMINMYDPMGIRKETFSGDYSDSSALSSWVSSVVRKWNGQADVASLPPSRSVEL